MLRPLVDQVGKASGESRAETQLDALLAAYLAARHGNTELAREDDRGATEGRQLSGTDADVQGRRRRARHAQGKPAETIRMLKPAVDGAELYVTHVALMEAYEATNDFKNALAEARWLAAHRGRAYAEYDPNRVPFNVVQSDLAMLHVATYAAALGDRDEAQRSLDTFLHSMAPRGRALVRESAAQEAPNEVLACCGLCGVPIDSSICGGEWQTHTPATLSIS